MIGKRAVFLLCGMTLLASGCSSSPTPSSSYYTGHHELWWYENDDYWYHYYPDSCVDERACKQRLQNWWDGLDTEQQQAVKDKVQDWKDDDMSANLDHLKQQLDTQWHSLPEERQQAIEQKWQSHYGSAERVRLPEPQNHQPQMNRPAIRSRIQTLPRTRKL
ncbi:hypothetical protein [Vibrio proteolyticus]